MTTRDPAYRDIVLRPEFAEALGGPFAARKSPAGEVKSILGMVIEACRNTVPRHRTEHPEITEREFAYFQPLLGAHIILSTKPGFSLADPDLLHSVSLSGGMQHWSVMDDLTFELTDGSEPPRHPDFDFNQVTLMFGNPQGHKETRRTLSLADERGLTVARAAIAGTAADFYANLERVRREGTQLS